MSRREWGDSEDYELLIQESVQMSASRHANQNKTSIFVLWEVLLKLFLTSDLYEVKIKHTFRELYLSKSFYWIDCKIDNFCAHYSNIYHDHINLCGL